MAALKPIRIQPARERVASALRAAIISKHFDAGEVLTLDSMAKELGVSVTPVREAFQILARDGLIEVKQGKTAVVRGLTETTIREHYQVRAALESYACVLCCETQADLSHVEELLAAARDAVGRGDTTDYSEQNQAIHYAIWTATCNDKLCSMLSELWNGLSMGVNVTQRAYAERSLAEHEQIFDALAARDAEAARNAMLAHIQRSERDIMTMYA